MINIKNIYWMLAYAFNNLNEADTKLIDKEEFDNIYDLFCVMLTQEISKLIKRGLFKEYITTTDEISSLKGKILLNDSIKKNSQKKMKMYCEFDVYSENIYLNQIIKTAAMYLIYSKKITDKVKIKKLKNVLNYLRDVDTVSIKTIKWNSIRYTKNNKIMAFITIEDLYGTAEVLAFENAVIGAGRSLVEENIVLIDGRLSIRDDQEPTIIANEIKDLGEQKPKVVTFDITDFTEVQKEKLRCAIKYFSGDKNNMNVQVKIGDDIRPCGAIYYNDEIKKIFDGICE